MVSEKAEWGAGIFIPFRRQWGPFPMVSVFTGNLDVHPAMKTCLSGFLPGCYKKRPNRDSGLSLIWGSNKATPQCHWETVTKHSYPPSQVDISEDSRKPELPRMFSNNDHTHSPPSGSSKATAPFPQQVLCERRPAKREEKIPSLTIPQMSSIQLKITCHTKSQKNFNSNNRRQWTPSPWWHWW